MTDTQSPEQSAAVAQLLHKLTLPNGAMARIGVLEPTDFTTQNFGELAYEGVTNSLQSYKSVPVERIAYTMTGLTLEEFRKVVVRYKLDIVIITVLKPTNFDMFLFDRRTPYSVYANTEMLPDEAQYQLTPETVDAYARALLRKTLYAYLLGHSYEVPRTESTPLLRYEIPRWVASQASVTMMNRELTSGFYGGAGVGGALAFGRNNRAWNSNMISLQLGRRIYGSWFADFTTEFFSYNTFVFSVKYHASNLDRPFGFSVGLGFAMMSSTHTLSFDPTFSQLAGSSYIVPSGTFLLPVGDIHFKLDARAYIGNRGNFMFTLAPGLQLYF